MFGITQWMILEYCLYVEVAVVSLLLIPFISANRWNALFKLFRSKKLGVIHNYASLVFYVIIGLLTIIFLSSWYNTAKFSHHGNHQNPNQHDKQKMKMFRSQRNLFVAGFSLFLFLVLARLVSLISQLANQTYYHKESAEKTSKED